MAGRRTLLSKEVRETLVAAIRAGAYDWVAAEAAGIGRRTFYDWLKRGEAGEAPYAEFAREVGQVRAEARIAAEQRVCEKDPLSWLRSGPGKDLEGAPGWTAPGKPRSATTGAEAADVMARAQAEVEP